MAASIYDTMPIEELEEYAYALQIPYNPLPDRVYS